MAFIKVELFAPKMARILPVNLYFPTDLPESVGNKVNGVITLLHGFSDSVSSWNLMSAANRYAADNGYIVIMPHADNSFYTNMKYGPNYYDWVAHDMPLALRKIFNIPAKRELNHIAGLSMGGYGALKIGLSNPLNYASCASFSGAVDIKALLLASKTPFVSQIAKQYVKDIFRPIFGPLLDAQNSDNIMHLCKRMSKLPKKEQVRIFCTCGVQDNAIHMIHLQNQRLRKAVKNIPLDFTYREWDGVHEWAFWSRSFAEYIGFIINNSYGELKKQDWN